MSLVDEESPRSVASNSYTNIGDGEGEETNVKKVKKVKRKKKREVGLSDDEVLLPGETYQAIAASPK